MTVGVLVLTLLACSGAEEGDTASAPATLADAKVTIVGTRSDGLRKPRDLDFNPDVPDELWVVNRGDRSVTIFHGAGTDQQEADDRLDPWGIHFMPDVSSIAFGGVTYAGSDARTFATCQESDNDYGGSFEGDGFMGPSLWTADLDLFAQSNPDAVDYLSELYGMFVDLGSHLDMLHESPFCMGIAWESDNVYWVFDGDDGRIVRYDFVEDHDRGFDDHSDGIISMYSKPRVERVKNVVSHMELDRETGLLYVADTGNNRVVVLDTNTGERGGNLFSVEPGVDHHEVDGADWWSLIEGSEFDGLDTPSGLALTDGHLILTDPSSGRIFVFTLEGELVESVDTGRGDGLAGIVARSLDDLWFVDVKANEVVRMQR